MLRHAPALCWLCAFVLATAPVVAAEPSVRIPGTQVSLVPPQGFQVAERFPGLQNEALFASIVISELPSPRDDLAAGLSAEALGARGMNMQQTESVRFGEREGTLVRIEQTLKSVVYEKWMALLGTASKSVFLSATYPLELAPQLRDDVRKALLSTTWDPDLALDVFDGLPFRIDPPKGLEIVSRSHALLTLSTPGTTLPIPASEPYMVVGQSVRPVSIEDLPRFAKQRLAQTPQIDQIQVISEKPIEIGGRAAYEFVAKAKSAEGDAALRVYQVVVSEGNAYTIVQGITPEGKAEDFLGSFAAVARSLAFR